MALSPFTVIRSLSPYLWSFIPSGLDQTFVDPSRPDWYVEIWSPGSVIAKRCLDEPACEAALAQRMREVLTIYRDADFRGLAIEMAEQVRSDVYADPGKEVNNSEFEVAVAATLDFIEGRPGLVESWLEERGY